MLLAAGFVELHTQLVQQYWRLASPDDLFAAFKAGTVLMAAVLGAQPEQASQTIRLAVREAVLEFAQDGKRTIAGMRKPPSSNSPFMPENGHVSENRSPPLSLVKMTIVLPLSPRTFSRPYSAPSEF